jgi:hypothetical protein
MSSRCAYASVLQLTSSPFHFTSFTQYEMPFVKHAKGLTEEGLLIVLILSQGYAWGGFQVSWSEDWSKPDGLSRSWRRALISWVFSMLHKWHFILCEGCEVEGWRGQLQYRCIGTPGTHRRWRWCWFSKIGDAYARLMVCTATTEV